MVFERGPIAFLDGSAKLLHDYVFYGTGVQNLSSLASAHISERISVLTSLRNSLATFLAQVYEEVDQIAEQVVNEPEKSLAPLIGTINGLFLKLEATIGHVSATRQVGSSVDGSYSSPLLFEKLPDINQEGSQWTDCTIRDAINMVYLNLDKLDVYLSLLVAKHQKPRKMTQHWILYTVVAVGVSLFSLWLLRHSRLAASSDIDNWIIEAKDSLKGFLNDHVEQPDTRAEGKGRIARVQRRHLIVEIEKRISQLQNFIDQGQEKDAQCMHGLILYTLDRLYRAVERPAKATGEWRSLRQDICDLGKPNLQTSNMLIVTSRIKQMYECLRPSVSR
ncbi:protein DGS1, mitochondrial-like [Rutidosis leptorrhynchoides]|uniref:protein DGS1, mitochondrial-like n=1 Tax=Rutidosis leptorrhynchoides TaxID=125765 RepID=UPI003A993CCC